MISSSGYFKISIAMATARLVSENRLFMSA